MRFRVFIFLICLASRAVALDRFYRQGDGCLEMTNKHKQNFKGCYRKADGTFDDDVLKKIDAFFDVPKDFGESFSLRTISYLDFLQDKYSPNKTFKVISGYRTPKQNEKLRAKGKLAGKTSYHLDAMAVDVVFSKVKYEEVWNYAKSLDYGGAGYYRGKELHFDSGKPRYWTPENAIDHIPPENKNIYMSIDRDIYEAGEIIHMFFSGLSEYPFGVKSTMQLMNGPTKILDIQPTIAGEEKNGCVKISNHAESRQLHWNLPKDFSTKNQKLTFKLEFCDPIYAKQPLTIDSREFEVR